MKNALGYKFEKKKKDAEKGGNDMKSNMSNNVNSNRGGKAPWSGIGASEGHRSQNAMRKNSGNFHNPNRKYSGNQSNNSFNKDENTFGRRQRRDSYQKV